MFTNLKLNMEEFEDNLFKAKFIFDGVQYVFKFANNYGASVVKHSGSYGCNEELWELAVIHFCDDEWHLTYDTEITDDVLGYLSNQDVLDLLAKIRNLK